MTVYSKQILLSLHLLFSHLMLYVQDSQPAGLGSTGIQVNKQIWLQWNLSEWTPLISEHLQLVNTFSRSLFFPLYLIWSVQIVCWFNLSLVNTSLLWTVNAFLGPKQQIYLRLMNTRPKKKAKMTIFVCLFDVHGVKQDQYHQNYSIHPIMQHISDVLRDMRFIS